MAGATNSKEAAMLDAALDVSGKYIALYTTMPADDGTGGVEVTTTSSNYARVSIGSTDWEAAIGGAPTTKAGPKSGVDWTFNVPTGSNNWGNVKGFGIVSASTGGTIEWLGLLPAPKDINIGDPAPVFNSAHQIIAQLGDIGDSF